MLPKPRIKPRTLLGDRNFSIGTIGLSAEGIFGITGKVGTPLATLPGDSGQRKAKKRPFPARKTQTCG